MAQVAAQPVESLLKKPEFVLCRRGIVIEWPHNRDFVLEQVTVAERVLAVALLQHLLFLHHHLTMQRREFAHMTGANFSELV